MLNLFILNETFTNGMSHGILNIISIISILSGILVIISKNPIVSVLFLIALFFSIAGYLMILGINFIGLSYLLVYVGAVSILFIFILMLINVRISELVTNSSNSIPLAVVIGIFFNLIIYELLPGNLNETSPLRGGGEIHQSNIISDFITTGKNIIGVSGNKNFDSTDVHFVTSQFWDGVLSESSHITSIGNVIYTNYPLWLILTSLILLLAMIGAIVITIKS